VGKTTHGAASTTTTVWGELPEESRQKNRRGWVWPGACRTIANFGRRKLSATGSPAGRGNGKGKRQRTKSVNFRGGWTSMRSRKLEVGLRDTGGFQEVVPEKKRAPT